MNEKAPSTPTIPFATEFDQLLPLWSFETHQRFLLDMFTYWEEATRNATLRHCKVVAAVLLIQARGETVTVAAVQQETGEVAEAVHRSMQRGIANGAVYEAPGADNKSHVYGLTVEGMASMRARWKKEVRRILELQREEADHALKNALISADEHQVLRKLSENHLAGLVEEDSQPGAPL